MIILPFSKHFQLIIDNSYVNKRQTKNGGFVYLQFAELSNFCSSSFEEKPPWNQKLFLRTLSIDIRQLKCQERQTIKTKNSEHFSANFSELLNFSSLSFRKKSLWNQKLQNLAFLLHTSKTCSNVEFFSIFSQIFFGSNFRHHWFCLQAVKKILHILHMCLNT